MNYKRNDKNQLIKTTPDGQSDSKLVQYGLRIEQVGGAKLRPNTPVRLAYSEQEINSVTGEEVGNAKPAGRLEDTLAGFCEYFAITPEALAAYFCDRYEEGAE